MNKSHIIHAAFALLIQAPFVLAGYPWLGAAAAIGFFIGIEWMQQTYIHVNATGRDWPTKLDLYDIWMGFMWDNRDRYGDTILPAIAVCAVAYLMEKP